MVQPSNQYSYGDELLLSKKEYTERLEQLSNETDKSEFNKSGSTLMLDNHTLKVIGSIQRIWESIKGWLGFENKANVVKVNYELLKLIQYGVDHHFLSDEKISGLLRNLQEKFENKSQYARIANVVNEILSQPNEVISQQKKSIVTINNKVSQYKSENSTNLQESLWPRLFHKYVYTPQNDPTMPIYELGCQLIAKGEIRQATNYLRQNLNVLAREPEKQLLVIDSYLAKLALVTNPADLEVVEFCNTILLFIHIDKSPFQDQSNLLRTLEEVNLLKAASLINTESYSEAAAIVQPLVNFSNFILLDRNAQLENIRNLLPNVDSHHCKLFVEKWILDNAKKISADHYKVAQREFNQANYSQAIIEAAKAQKSDPTNLDNNKLIVELLSKLPPLDIEVKQYFTTLKTPEEFCLSLEQLTRNDVNKLDYAILISDLRINTILSLQKTDTKESLNKVNDLVNYNVNFLKQLIIDEKNISGIDQTLTEFQIKKTYAAKLFCNLDKIDSVGLDGSNDLIRILKEGIGHFPPESNRNENVLNEILYDLGLMLLYTNASDSRRLQTVKLYELVIDNFSTLAPHCEHADDFINDFKLAIIDKLNAILVPIRATAQANKVLNPSSQLQSSEKKRIIDISEQLINKCDQFIKFYKTTDAKYPKSKHLNLAFETYKELQSLIPQADNLPALKTQLQKTVLEKLQASNSKNNRDLIFICNCANFLFEGSPNKVEFLKAYATQLSLAGKTDEVSKLWIREIDKDRENSELYFAYGSHLVNQQEYTQAISALKGALDRDSSNNTYKQALIGAYTSIGDVFLNQAKLQVDPQEVRHNLNDTVKIALQNEQFKQSLKSALEEKSGLSRLFSKKISDQQKDKLNMFIALGQKTLVLDDPDLKEDVRLALETFPWIASHGKFALPQELSSKLAALRENANNLKQTPIDQDTPAKEAASNYLSACKLTVNNFNECHNKLIDAYVQDGRYDLAIKFYNACSSNSKFSNEDVKKLRIDPKAYKGLIETHLKEGTRESIDNAIIASKFAIKLYSTNPLFNELLSQSFLAAGKAARREAKYDDAIGFLTQATSLKANKHSAQCHAELGMIYHIFPKAPVSYKEKALEHLKEASLLDKDNAYCQFAYAKFLIEEYPRDETRKAIGLFKQAAKLDPTNPLYAYALYSAYRNNAQNDESDKALAQFKKLGGKLGENLGNQYFID